MADYGGKGGGQSLRDALNFAYPLTGLGEYGAGYPPAMFPPQTGAPQPGPPVPIPQPRPPMPPQAGPYLPPPGAALAAGSPTVTGQPVAPPLPPQANLGIAGSPQGPMVGGGLNMPINPNLAPGGNYGLRLGLNQRF